MKKSVLIAAGAIAFDLGVMVVAAHAAPTKDIKVEDTAAQAKIKIQDTAPQAKTDYYLKYELVKNGHKVGTVANADGCKTAGGKIEVQSFSWGASQKVCVLPAKPGAK